MADSQDIQDNSTEIQDPPKRKAGRPRGSRTRTRNVALAGANFKIPAELMGGAKTGITPLAKTTFKDMREALNFLMARECPVAGFEGLSNRQALAQVLMAMALTGDREALKLCIERTDGKLFEQPAIAIDTVIVRPDAKNPQTAPPALLPEFEDDIVDAEVSPISAIPPRGA